MEAVVPWEGRVEQYRALLIALREVSATYSFGLLASCIAADKTSQELAARLAKIRHAPVNRTTLERWINGLDPDPTSSVPDAAVQAFRKKDYSLQQIVYEFLERSTAIRTSLFNPARGLPHGFAEFVSDSRKPLARLRFEGLQNLDGVYAMYRRSWTTPERRDRVLISRLEIESVSGTTRFREVQDFRDDARGNMPVQQADHGLIFNSGLNIFFMGFGSEQARVKFFAVHSWAPQIEGEQPVHELKGTLIGAAAEGPHPGYPFLAYRVDEPEALVSQVVPAASVNSDIASYIGCETAT
jgi:hypothetical protein